MMKAVKLIGLLLLCLLSMGCSSDEDTIGQETYSGIPLIILDVDVPSSTDDLFALQMLYRYADEEKCKLLGVVVDREGQAGAEVVDIMNNYYGYPDVPIGLVREGIDNPKVWIDYSPLATHCTPDGQPMFRRTHSDYHALPEGWKLYRRLLAAQPDHSVSICSVGFVTCLAWLLESGPDEYSPLNGIELVKQKVKAIYVMGGIFGQSVEPEYNFAQGIGFAQTFFRLWPEDVDMFFSPGEVGDGIVYPDALVLEDYAWDEYNPIRQVYQHYPCDSGQKMWDPLTIIQAVEGDGLFTLSEWGYVEITPQAETLFTPSTNGNCRYQLPGSVEWNSQMLEKIRESGFKR